MRTINNLDEMMADLNQGNSGVSLYFKPDPGRTTIRIVSPDGTFPVRSYWYHYNIAEKPVYSRYRNLKDMNDPLNQYTQQLWKADNQEEYRSVKANCRFYAPVIVRGQEHLGVKIWSFSKKCFSDMVDELKSVGADKTFYDSREGTDITLIYKKPATGYPSTQLVAADKPSSVADKDEDITRIEVDCPDIDKMHPEISAEDALALVEDKLETTQIKKASTPQVSRESDQDHFEANDHQADDIPF